MKRVLFVANGHGETAIAARIGAELQRRAAVPLGLDLLPIVGLGLGAAPLALVGPRAAMPSGGLVAMGNVRAFSRDVLAGFLALFCRQVAFLVSARGRYDAVLAVGDIYALGLAFLAHAPAAFVGTAKSAYVAPYGPFERVLMRRAALAFVRDAPTARVLESHGVAARAPGNVIVDLLDEQSDAGPSLPSDARHACAIAILPGSRAEAYADGVRLARVVRALGVRRPGIRAQLSIAPTLCAERFASVLAADGWIVADGDDGALPFVATAPGVQIGAARGRLGALLRESRIVLGQAGTANEQAAACGVPVVALADPAGREDWYRMRQRRLLGDALAIVPSEPGQAAAALDALLGDDARLEQMSRVGRERMGDAGGAAAVAEAVLALLA